MSDLPADQTFDRKLIRARAARALSGCDYPDFLYCRVLDDICDRLGLVLREFDTALVVADRPHDVAQTLMATGRIGRIFSAHTVATNAVSDSFQLVCDEEFLPVADRSLDCVISLLNLHHVNDLPGALIQILRALRPDGLFVAALLGGTTLNELRHAWLAAESQMTAGASPRVAPFADIRDMGGLLQRAGFALPVVDADRLTVTYRDALSVMRELKHMGLSNALNQRRRAPVTRRTLAQACAIYEQSFSDEAGRVPATFEIIYLTGWAPHDSQQQPLRPGSAKSRLADALSTREHPLKNS